MPFMTNIDFTKKNRASPSCSSAGKGHGVLVRVHEFENSHCSKIIIITIIKIRATSNSLNPLKDKFVLMVTFFEG